MGSVKRTALILIVSGLTAFATAVMLTIVLAVVDVYLSGHSQPVLSRPWLEYTEWGVSMSRADAILLMGTAAAALGSGAVAAVGLGIHSR